MVVIYNIENFLVNKKEIIDEKVKVLVYFIKYNLKMLDIIGVEEM